MLLLVSGASCVGKSTVRMHARHLLDASFEDAEFFTLGPVPEVPTVAWRHQQTERAVRRAIELEREGRHLLLAGDPVPAGEALAAPSADQIDCAVCLLDVRPDVHLARLRGRGEPEELDEANLGFAAWMREHAVNPSHVPEAITTDAWPGMRWERFVGRAPGPEWAMTVIDTSALGVADVAERVADWCRAAVVGEAPVFRAGWFRG